LVLLSWEVSSLWMSQTGDERGVRPEATDDLLLSLVFSSDLICGSGKDQRQRGRERERERGQEEKQREREIDRARSRRETERDREREGDYTSQGLLLGR
jgi:hypothetical protein